jgi:hypothetical protein
LLAVLLAGCGVSFGGEEEGNEFFTSVDILGEARVGSPMTALVHIDQAYNVQVDVRCELYRGSSQVRQFAQDSVPPHPEGGPTATPFPAEFAYDFIPADPGRYSFECFTAVDDDNFIRDYFDVGPAATPAPAP